MWNDRPPKEQVVVWGNIEEMDVSLSQPELRDYFTGMDGVDQASTLLAGGFSLEPWVRVRIADDWILTSGVEVTPTDDEG